MIGPAVGVEPAVGQVANARCEPEPKKMAKTEDVLGYAARISVVLLDGQRSLVMKKTLKNMERFACIGRTDFGVERHVAIGDVSIKLDTGLGTVASIVLGPGFAVAASPEELAIRR